MEGVSTSISIDLLEDGVLRFSNTTCLEATLCNTCNIGGSSSAMASDIAEMKAQIAANTAINNDIIYRLEAIENQSVAHENILNPPCPNRDLGSATNPATSCKAIMDLRTADATVWPSECSLPDSGIFYVSHRVAQSPLLHRLRAPPPHLLSRYSYGPPSLACTIAHRQQQPIRHYW
jgi:hypothetical protein